MLKSVYNLNTGCRRCDCNGHGIANEGDCDILTGVCHCKDNTEGDHCERCKPNYYGDPAKGGLCYYQCEPRGMLSQSLGQGISSRKAYTPPWGGAPTRECLWIIDPEVESGSVIIQLQVNASQMNITCGENAVYVYDGPPELVDMGSQSALSAVFCSEEALQSAIVESRTGKFLFYFPPLLNIIEKILFYSKRKECLLAFEIITKFFQISFKF